MPTLPEINFAPIDARGIEASLITGFEAAARRAGQTDFTLYDGDPRRLFLGSIALLILQLCALIDQTGKGNLLRYAGDATIEDIGWLYGTRADRLQPSRAVTTVEFTLSAERNTVTTVPAGTRVVAGTLTFVTALNLDIPAKTLTGQALAECEVTGPAGNGMPPGQVFQIVDRVPFVDKAVNVTGSAGGSDLEDLEMYRERVRNTPESFSTAGPEGAYWFWAMTANPGIVDVDVWMPDLDTEFFRLFLEEVLAGGVTVVDGEAALHWYERFMGLCRESGTGPGNVNIVALMEDGKLATEDIREAIYSICNDKTRRPLTDFLHVVEGEYVDYGLDFTYWIDAARSADAIAIQAAVGEAASEYIRWQCGELGRAIIPDELTRLVKTAGARRLEITAPHYINLKQGQVARLVSQDIRYGGLERNG